MKMPVIAVKSWRSRACIKAARPAWSKHISTARWDTWVRGVQFIGWWDLHARLSPKLQSIPDLYQVAGQTVASYEYHPPVATLLPPASLKRSTFIKKMLYIPIIHFSTDQSRWAGATTQITMYSILKVFLVRFITSCSLQLKIDRNNIVSKHGISNDLFPNSCMSSSSPRVA